MRKTIALVSLVVLMSGFAMAQPDQWFRPQKIASEFSWSPAMPESGQPIQFTDHSIGNIVAWQWRFSDWSGGSKEQNPVHAYKLPGQYRVWLTVWDSLGRTRTTIKLITVIPEMTAWFTWSPEKPIETLPIQFTDMSSGLDIVKWHWDFGDGGTSDEQNPVHAYSKAGDYVVTLAIWDSKGMKSQVSVSI